MMLPKQYLGQFQPMGLEMVPASLTSILFLSATTSRAQTESHHGIVKDSASNDMIKMYSDFMVYENSHAMP
jgi:hypothetical protein